MKGLPWIALILSWEVVDSFQLGVWPISRPRLSPSTLALADAGAGDHSYWGDEEMEPKASAPPPFLFALDPTSDEAKTIVVDGLGLTESHLTKFIDLCDAVVEWNERINLVSRKDCNPSTVFGRHVLPSISCLGLDTDDYPLAGAKSVLDVGTGGGFPGLPLAICHPEIDFVLLDSVGKKLNAVQDMANQLELDNVKIHHGRAEDFVDRKFDVATGRSVSSLDKFCSWMHHVLEPDTGKLMYWIGGPVQESILNKAESKTPVDQLVDGLESDKRILVFPSAAVTQIAQDSGIVVKRNTNQGSSKKRKILRKKKAKGSWEKRRNDPDVVKDRGYENFQRYSSTPASQ